MYLAILLTLVKTSLYIGIAALKHGAHLNQIHTCSLEVAGSASSRPSIAKDSEQVDHTLVIVSDQYNSLPAREAGQTVMCARKIVAGKQKAKNLDIVESRDSCKVLGVMSSAGQWTCQPSRRTLTME